jgi:hypothetical protein
MVDPIHPVSIGEVQIANGINCHALRAGQLIGSRKTE